MKARTRPRTASSRGSNQSPPAKGDGDVAAADVASVMAWVPSRSCRSEPTPPQLFPTNLAPRPATLPGALVPAAAVAVEHQRHQDHAEHAGDDDPEHAGDPAGEAELHVLEPAHDPDDQQPSLLEAHSDCPVLAEWLIPLSAMR